ncbi:MAG TPA: hypothetical protein VEA63_14820, partial [Opitutus sp.]|nr:hypothetical protein [Opitutus sp.]
MLEHCPPKRCLHFAQAVPRFDPSHGVSKAARFDRQQKRSSRTFSTGNAHAGFDLEEELKGVDTEHTAKRESRFTAGDENALNIVLDDEPGRLRDN